MDPASALTPPAPLFFQFASKRARPIADVARLCLSDVAPDVFIKQQTLPIEADGCARHFPDVLFVGRIPFFSRESRVADRQAISLRLLKVDLLARHVTKIVTGKGGNSQSPARVRGQRDGDLRETDTSDVVPIGIGPRNEGRVRESTIDGGSVVRTPSSNEGP